MKNWVTILGYSLAAIFLVLGIVSTVVSNNKIDDLLVEISESSANSALEASDNSVSIYTFSKYQYDNKIIDAKGYSEALVKLIQSHDNLITLVTEDSDTDTNVEKMKQAIKILETRKDAYVNIKSALEMGAENFNVVAEGKFNEATTLRLEYENMK